MDNVIRTLVLLSGGLDSAVVLAACVKQGDECAAIGFDYGQSHGIELDRAEEIADHYGVPFDRIGLPPFLKFKTDDVVFAGRNLVLASLAIARAQAHRYDRIAVGCNASDWQRFPDCRPPFWRELGRCAGTYGVTVLTPLIYLSKRDVVEQASRLNVPIDLTWSCYHPNGAEPCGQCLACTTRQEALA